MARGHRVAEASCPRARRLLDPEARILFDRLVCRNLIDSALAQLLSNSTRAVSEAEAGVDEPLGEPRLAQEPLRFERVEHAFDRGIVAIDRGELERELAAGMFAASEQLQGARPDRLVLLGGQASTASAGFSAESRRPGISRSRRAVSIACAACFCCLRKSRTLSRP